MLIVRAAGFVFTVLGVLLLLCVLERLSPVLALSATCIGSGVTLLYVSRED